MKARKKNRFLTFCFSFMPGAGEMYMGFFKTGISLMCLFLFSLVVLSMLSLDEFSACIAIPVWFYGFFHVNHLVSLTDEELAEIEDGYLFTDSGFENTFGWAAKYQKLLAGLLIAAGVMMFWNTAVEIARGFLPEYVWRMMMTVGNYVPRVVVAILIMIVGVKLIKGKKAQLVNEAVSSAVQEEK